MLLLAGPGLIVEGRHLIFHTDPDQPFDMDSGPFGYRLFGGPVLQGVLFVLYAGVEWEGLPQELGFGSG